MERETDERVSVEEAIAEHDAEYGAQPTRYSEADYRAAIGAAIENLEWILKGFDTEYEDDEVRVEHEAHLEVLKHLYRWHGGEDVPTLAWGSAGEPIRDLR